ncbi:FemAB family protein [Polynucleobacter bastaniensis]|uniref:FemAB family protein n=1 Tax=Polynucleobacter bastaniensis TaxID=2081039 RepID=UPI001C0DC4E8|nr:FemAB family protein [Polynucleobacter bastaniensis]MBU3598260.1 FemAB family protein [Polynucleobacter bastaniensis]
MYVNVVKNYADINGLNISFRLESLDKWMTVLRGASYIPVLYTNNSLEFQWANHKSHVSKSEDISMVINWNNEPVAIWPLSMSTNCNSETLSSQGLPILPPLFIASCPNITQKRIFKKCIEMAEFLAIKIKVSEFESQVMFSDLIGLSPWHSEAMLNGASCTIQYDLFVDLQRTVSDIKAGFRKSYRSLVIPRKNEWSIAVLDVSDEHVWNEFKNLHYFVAGRKTRSDLTWKVHFDDIVNKDGFLVYLRDQAGAMVGGGFFNFTRDEGFYSVGAYRRDLFDRPLGHLIQFQAILELKKRGVHWYRLGTRPYLSAKPQPTAKEISIGNFKQGFSSHMFPRYLLRHALSS